MNRWIICDSTKEQWRWVVGFKRRYRVSTFGRVKSVLTGTILKATPNERVATGVFFNREIGEIYNVSESTISAIKRGTRRRFG